jgi:hypothetical protein
MLDLLSGFVQIWLDLIVAGSLTISSLAGATKLSGNFKDNRREEKSNTICFIGSESKWERTGLQSALQISSR